MISRFLSRAVELFQEDVDSFRKEFAHIDANSSLQELTSIEKGGKKENDRVDSPENAPFTLRITFK